MYQLARKYEDAGDYTRSRALYQQILHDFNTSDYATHATMNIFRSRIMEVIDDQQDTDIITVTDQFIAAFDPTPQLTESVSRIAEQYYIRGTREIFNRFSAIESQIATFRFTPIYARSARREYRSPSAQ